MTQDVLRKSKLSILLAYLLVHVLGIRGLLLRSFEMKGQVFVLVALPMLALLLSLSYLKDTDQLSLFQIKKPNLSTLSWMGIVALIVMILQGWVLLFAPTYQESQQLVSNIILRVSREGGNVLFFLLMLHTCVTGPIFEEVFCRGVLMTHFFKDSTYYFDVVLSAILFSIGHFELLHFQPVYFVYFFVSGLGLGFLFRKTKSIYPPIMLHCLWNIYASWQELEILFNHIGLWIKLNFN